MPEYPTEIRMAPWAGPPRPARVRVPGSKSLTNRALIVAALADGESQLTGALDSEDTRVMVDSLRRLGIEVEHDPAAASITVRGCGGEIPAGEAELFVANSGTSLRFLTAMVATAASECGGLDGIHVNAADMQAIRSDGDALDLDLAVFDRTLAVNLRGHLLCTRAALPELLKRGGGAIVYTSSGAAGGVNRHNRCVESRSTRTTVNPAWPITGVGEYSLSGVAVTCSV